jgi:sulfur relay (sulfurtransferase) DsrC/TusE family protein
MPKIPTFTAKGSITSEPSAVVSDIQLSPRSTMASALIPAADQIQAYSIKKRDNEEKLEAKKTLLNLKAESDKIVESLKGNPNEQESIDVWKTNFQNLSKNKIANIQNKRIKKLVEDSLSLEESESIYHLKTNSFKAYEKESIQVYNDKINMDVAKYKGTDNAILKVKYKEELYRDATDFNNEHELGSSDLENRLKTIDASLLFVDSDYTIGLGFNNTADEIAKLDSGINGASFINDEIFSNNIYASYNQKINDLTVKGDPNADYDEAERLLSQLKSFERYTGSKVVSGDREVKFANLEQKILVEKIGHEDLLRKIKMGNDFEEYNKNQKSILGSEFFNALDARFNKSANKEKSEEAIFEYDQRMDLFLSSNPDANTFEMQQYSRDLRLNLIDKYQETSIETITAFNLEENKFNVIREARDVNRSYEEYKTNPAAKNILKTLAKLNGYLNADGSPDVNMFMNDYTKILKQRQEG